MGRGVPSHTSRPCCVPISLKRREVWCRDGRGESKRMTFFILSVYRRTLSILPQSSFSDFDLGKAGRVRAVAKAKTPYLTLADQIGWLLDGGV